MVYCPFCNCDASEVSLSKCDEGWRPPVQNSILINCDAAVPEGKNGCGLGVDHRGRVLEAQASYFDGEFSVETAESMALRCGLRLAKKLGCRNFWLSSDCINVVEC
ncbi:hypothetical protein POM88_011658 [Heracleum sosnowskyi]|uniref:RNase H type-1 domain-containing protein n=1 Tax=Heracleum sosnowskyi TaxID=360622 RepID=A0AAD8IUY6_9APIA|nr:hypothetical protein POM88_011658 [Heracleum sosnowskyi]